MVENILADHFFHGGLFQTARSSLPPLAARRIFVLQNELKGKSTKIVLLLFDLLYLNGHDLRKLPLTDRKKHLRKIIATFSWVTTTSKPALLSKKVTAPASFLGLGVRNMLVFGIADYSATRLSAMRGWLEGRSNSHCDAKKLRI